MIETHCHLDYLKQDSLENIISRSVQAGVEKIITISVDPNNLDKVIEISTQFSEVYCTQGIHPHDAKFSNNDVLHKIENHCLNHSKIVAIGEIGLDYHYMQSEKQIQIEVFRLQMQLAAKLNYPIVIHSREADEDMIVELKNNASQLKKKGVLHSFTSTAALAQTALDLGFYLGFNGIITFKNADDVRSIVELTPLDRILIETDSPFLTPIPYRGRENAPFYLPHIVKKIAEIKNLRLDKVIEQTTLNAKNLFFS